MFTLSAKIRHKINHLGRHKIPFWFMIDFLGQDAYVLDTNELKGENIFFDYQGNTNYEDDFITNNPHINTEQEVLFQKFPVSFEAYQEAFEQVQYHIKRGDTYLINLSAPTLIKSNLSLWNIFLRSKAKYRLFFKNKFTCFSPEIFIQIKQGQIFTYPMKGTIEAQLPESQAQLLADPKEKAEHHTIVDLLRNDLSRVSKKVCVQRFRYLDRLITSEKDLWQVSSEIKGELAPDYLNYLGDILAQLLPAGSISGAPKPKTLEIISHAENYERGYYTGITGYFDGQDLDSGVMIRFIEQQGNELYFKSGGGLTFMSEASKEYQELIDKVYLPFPKKLVVFK